jgi:hypothetical protein
MPAYALVRGEIDEDVRTSLTAFQGRRGIRRPIGAEGDRVATAWLARNVMLGGGSTPRGRTATDQAYPATVHWKLPDGGIGWIRLLCESPVTATARESALTIVCRLAETKTPCDRAVFLIHGTGLKAEGLSGNEWRLPGLTVAIQTDLAAPEFHKVGEGVEARYTIPDSRQHGTVTIVLNLR